MNRLEIRRAYRVRNRLRLLAQQKLWRDSNRIKCQAHKQVALAVRHGVLTKPMSCQKCKSPGRVEAHHPDYSLPLAVQWLCHKCHASAHRMPIPSNHPKGERHGCAKLTSPQVQEIRRLHGDGKSQESLARQFKTSAPNIRMIITGQTWKHLLQKL